jgi:transcription initiation protein SPT3
MLSIDFLSYFELIGPEKKAPRKEVIKLPWEPLTSFAEVLKNLPNRAGGATNVEEEEDEDELEAYEDSLQRLRVSSEVCSNVGRRFD